ncbi:MAG: GtrA family protein [Oscillospiraceae bacterium]|nr:GtrA family protein [Oscillospiraceae bacterium]
MKLLIDSVFRKLKAESPEERKALIRQFIKFGLVGLSNTLVAWAVYYLVLWLNPDLYMVGSIAGTVISIANAFFWNDRFVFKGAEKDRKSKLKRLGKTYVSYGGTSILATVLLWAEVRFLGVGKVFAPVLNLLITIPLNFLINKFWTFHK